MKIKYINHNGEAFTLYGDDLTFIEPMDLHAFEWSYELANRVTGFGGTASGFARWPRTFDLELRMRGYTRAQFLQQMNRLAAVTDADQIAGQPGKLHVISEDGTVDQYITCFFAVGSAAPAHVKNSNFATRMVTVLVTEPYWITETAFNIYAGSPEGDSDDNYGKKYNYRYGYRYSTGLGGNTIINTHYAPTPVKITAFGPVANPSVSIGGNVYAVHVTILAGQQLVIDPLGNDKIYILSETGEKTNVFNDRDKAHDIFALVQPGENAVIYSGDFNLTVTLIQQRSELLWTD